MIKVRKDLSGKHIGMLTVIRQVDDYVSPMGCKDSNWLCVCDCEEHNECVRSSTYLRLVETPSCGCAGKIKEIQRGKDSKKHNVFDLSGDYGVGWTTNTGVEFYFDLEDYDKIKDYSWREHINLDGYHSLRTIDPNRSKCAIKMSEVITGKKRCEHKNRNALDNRKENLREATTQENNRNRGRRKDNRSGVIGVWWDKRRNKWYAYIRVDGELISLGHFINKDEAIRHRLCAEVQYFKDFAPQQHLYERYGITQHNG